MNPEEIRELIKQVQFNCELASLRQAGTFSVCGLAMRLRDLYKWEHGLLPWQEGDSEDVLRWIGKKEEYWESIEHMSYRDISVRGRTIQPMDMESLNTIINTQGLLYGAGLGEGITPSFFLADLDSEQKISDIRVSILSREHARDLIGTPAMARERHILIRKEALSFYVWNSILFARKENKKDFLECFRSFGLNEWNYEEIKRLIPAVVEENIMAFVYHEMGEIRDNIIDLDTYHALVKKYQRTFVEFFLRSLRDLMADTNEYGRLCWIVQTKNYQALALSMALLDDFRKNIYCQIRQAYIEFSSDRSWMRIENAIKENREMGKELLDKSISILETSNKSQSEIIELLRQTIKCSYLEGTR